MRILQRGWMWVSLVLALIIGVSAGVIADRLAFEDRLGPDKGGSRGGGLLWFSCDGGDIEEDPAYPYRPEHRDYLVRGLRKRLDLDAEQVGALETLLEEKREGARLYWTRTRDAYCRMQSSFRSDIRGLLRPEQAEVYDELLRRVDARHRERLESSRSGSRHPSHPPGAKPRPGEPPSADL